MRTFISRIVMIVVLCLVACDTEQSDNNTNLSVEIEDDERELCKIFVLDEENYEEIRVTSIHLGENSGIWVHQDNDQQIESWYLKDNHHVYDAYIFGLLNGAPLTRLCTGAYWQMFYKDDAHPVRSAESGDHMDEKTYFEVQRDGVVVVHQTGFPPVGQIVFAYQFGKKLTFSSDMPRKWVFLWDEELSWERQCQELKVEREMNDFGEITGFWISCDSGNEMLGPHKELLGIM